MDTFLTNNAENVDLREHLTYENLPIYSIYKPIYQKKLNAKIDPQNRRAATKLQAAANSHEIIWREPLFSARRIRPA